MLRSYVVVSILKKWRSKLSELKFTTVLFLKNDLLKKLKSFELQHLLSWHFTFFKI